MDFFHQYFVLPWLQNGMFNTFNTMVYGVGLIIGFFLVLRLLRVLKVKPDFKLMSAILPFIVLAGSTRALRDYVYSNMARMAVTDYARFFSDIGYNYGIVQEQTKAYLSGLLPEPVAWSWSYIVAWFPTPASYFITFFIALVILLVAVAWERKGGKEYWKTMGLTGVVMAAFSVYLLPISNPVALGFIMLFFSIWSGLFLGLRYFIHSNAYLKRLRKDHRKPVKDLFSWENTGIVIAHILDASATFTAMTFYSFSEQHVVPNIIIPILGPVSMFILKIAVVLPALYLIDKYAEEQEFRGLLKIVILILGLAPAIRNLLTLAVY